MIIHRYSEFDAYEYEVGDHVVFIREDDLEWENKYLREEEFLVVVPDHNWFPQKGESWTTKYYYVRRPDSDMSFRHKRWDLKPYPGNKITKIVDETVTA